MTFFVDLQSENTENDSHIDAHMCSVYIRYFMLS